MDPRCVTFPRSTRHMLVSLVLCLPFTAHAQQDTPSPEPKQDLVKAQDPSEPEIPQRVQDEVTRYQHQLGRVIALCERRLATHEQLLRKRIATPARVDALREQLCVHRHNLALTQRDREAMQDQKRAILEIRKRQRARLWKLREQGHDYKYRILAAERQIAVLEYLLRSPDTPNAVTTKLLDKVVEFCKQETTSWEAAFADKLALRLHVTEARSRQISAEYLRIGKDSPDVLPLLQSQVALLDRDYQQIATQFENRTATFLDRTFLVA